MRFLLLWRIVRSDLRLLWLALRHPHRPAWLIPASAALAVLAFQPLNFAIPVLGVINEFVILPLLLHGVLSLLPERIRMEFKNREPLEQKLRHIKPIRPLGTRR